MNARPMVGMFGQKVPMGQANGPDVDLIVSGTELYATYETPEGFPAVYDDALGLFCYARIVGGRFEVIGCFRCFAAAARRAVAWRRERRSQAAEDRRADRTNEPEFPSRTTRGVVR